MHDTLTSNLMCIMHLLHIMHCRNIYGFTLRAVGDTSPPPNPGSLQANGYDWVVMVLHSSAYMQLCHCTHYHTSNITCSYMYMYNIPVSTHGKIHRILQIDPANKVSVLHNIPVSTHGKIHQILQIDPANSVCTCPLALSSAEWFLILAPP